MLSKVNTPAMLRSMLKNSVVTMQMRDFAKKTKRSKTSDGLSEYETPEEVAEPAVTFDSKSTRDTRNAPWLIQNGVLNLDKDLFKAFSIGDIKKVSSTPDNKAPSYEDTIEGRYANVLFTTASVQGALFDIYEDMMYLSELYTHSEIFRQFTENSGVGVKEIGLLN